MNYPIYLTNMNRLSTTKKMVEDLFRMNSNSNITIIDNASTYPPLLEWYEKIKSDITIHRNKTNLGPWSFFYSGISGTVKDTHYVYSDADLELNPDMPYNWQEIMMEYLNKYKRKPSLALRISDIPEGDLRNQILNHQNICWDKTDEPDVYLAVTDMTFTLDAKVNGYRYPSVRLAGNFECRHIPWYLDMDNLPEEEKYYIEHLDDRFPEARWSKLNKEKLCMNQQKSTH